MTTLTIEYVAGFFDGEGCCKVVKQKKNGKEYGHLTILLSQSGDDGLALLEEIQTQYGGKIYKHLSKGQHKATKDAYKLYWNKDEGLTFLVTLLPYLRMKRKDVQCGIDYLRRKNGTKAIQD